MFINLRGNKTRLFILIIIVFVYNSCSPKIKYFDVNNRTITAEDSLIFSWDVCGTAALLFHETPTADSSGVKPIDSSAKLLNYTLVVTKGGKEKSQTIQVILLPNQSTDLIIFKSELSINGDTLVAIGEKNPKRWGQLFEIVTLASDTGVSLNVRHDGRTVDLNKSGAPATSLKGTPVEGHWEFRHLLTQSEKDNPTRSLEFLRVHSTIQYKRR